jgi:hypothetical protein
MKTRLQLEQDLIDAGGIYSQLVKQTLSIERQSPSPHTPQWHELNVLKDQRRTALWAYNRIFAQLKVGAFQEESERKEA